MTPREGAHHPLSNVVSLGGVSSKVLSKGGKALTVLSHIAVVLPNAVIKSSMGLNFAVFIFGIC